MVPIDTDPPELTSFVLGDLREPEATEFEAMLRGDAEMRRKVADTTVIVDVLEDGLRPGPGGLSDDQRHAVLDHLEDVLAGNVVKPPVEVDEDEITKLKRTGHPAQRRAFFSPNKAFNAAAVAALIMLAVCGSFVLGVFNEHLAVLVSAGKPALETNALETGLRGDPLVAGVEGDQFEMRVRLALPEVVDPVADDTAMIAEVNEQAEDVADSEADLVPWGRWVNRMLARAELVKTTAEDVADSEETAAVAAINEPVEASAVTHDEGFRSASSEGVSAVPVVASSDFYGELWSNVRRDYRLPQQEVVAVEQLVNYFPYNYPEPRFGDSLSVSVETGECPWNRTHALVRIGIRGRDVPGGGSEEVVARDIGVVADFNPAMVQSYRLIGYARCSQDAVVGKVVQDAGNGSDLHSNQTVTALYEVIPFGANGVVESQIVERRSDLKERGSHHPVGLYAGIFEREDGATANDLLSVRVIFREPGTMNHLKKVVSVPPVMKRWVHLDEDFRFAASVAGFGMRLKGDLSSEALGYDAIAKLAGSALGSDPDGRRAEFLALVKQVKSLPPVMRAVESEPTTGLAAPQVVRPAIGYGE